MLPSSQRLRGWVPSSAPLRTEKIGHYLPVVLNDRSWALPSAFPYIKGHLFSISPLELKPFSLLLVHTDDRES